MSLTSDTAPKPSPANGFTLIELLIAIAILAIIMGIAIPSYNQWVVKSNRADAKGALFGAAQTLERCFTRYSAYNHANCNAAKPAPVGIDGQMSENDKYQLSITSIDGTSYTLTATPQGSQTSDTECGNFTLDERGAKGVSGSGTVDDCW